jgi:hypothetical protein
MYSTVMKTIKASLDRYEGNFAVIYSDEDDDLKFDIPRKLVPPNIKEGSRVLVSVREENNQIIKVQLDSQGTEDARKRITNKFQRLLKGEHLKP